MEKHIWVLCLLNLLLQQAGCEDLVNIALNKTPTQSGTFEYPAGTFWDVSHSVDGMTECAPPVTGQHYSATVDAIDPWWQLDLGTIHIIKAMHLLGRPDTHKQLGGFRLWAGLDINTLAIVYEDNWKAYNNGTIWVNNTIIARVIKIDLPRDHSADRIVPGPLVLCEVEILISNVEANIKHTSTTSGSGIYGGFGSNLAIDGKYPSASKITPEFCNCCSITTGTGTLWWTIDFGQPRLIRRVDITGRMDQANQNQSKDLSIFISSTSPEPTSGLFGDLVWNITSSESGNFFKHTFPSPRVFRYMTITQPGLSTHYMTICEVDFNTVDCQEGHYGTSCNETCGYCVEGTTTCSVTDGACPHGCAPGYNSTDKTCKTCLFGHYGSNCMETCGQCRDGPSTCSVTDGTCQHGCAPGYDYSDKTCKTCLFGHYGSNCMETCGQCRDGPSTCSVTDGTCQHGCAPGYDYSDKTCTICLHGHYGSNCTETCGQCRDGPATCTITDGTCQHGCAPGYDYSDKTCKTCLHGHYGSNCTETCGQCRDGPSTCSVTDGTCQHGCAPGYDYSEKTCKTCLHGHYGFNCMETCGHCRDGPSTCSVTDGTCQHGCAPGYDFSDKTCKTCLHGHYGSNCMETCGQCRGGPSTCSVTDGTCQHGCAPGYIHTDTKCKTECQPGRYGSNCSNTCGHCIPNNTICSVSNGTCPTGCSPGYDYTRDQTCKAVCLSGQYGNNCSHYCGHCIKGMNTCQPIDGTCPDGCAPGYDPSDLTCKTECRPKHYGLNCSLNCGQCIHGTTSCLKNNGTCLDGCAPGYDPQDMTCNTVCSPGKFGPNCAESCGQCLDGNTTCSTSNGTCQTGCAHGYTISDKTCRTECEAGTYGLNCAGECGSCKNGPMDCLKITGVCQSRQCAEGYYGDMCQEATNNTAQIVGAIVGVVALVTAVVVLFVVLKRKGCLPRRKPGKTNSGADSQFVNLEALVRERESKTAKQAAVSDEHRSAHDNGGYYSFNPDDHVENRIRIRDLWDYITNNRANNFQDLFDEFQAVPGGLQFECSAAQCDENIGKNKYRNMYPYDHCRVKLKVPDGQTLHTDYINASHVDGYERLKKFIAAQGPKKGTIEDFWLMVWQQGVRKVVMLTNVFEMGKDKCEQYWPNEGASVQYGGIEVTSKGTTEKSDYSIRQFELRMEHEKVRRVDQFHFKSWPDKDVPDNTWCLVNFWRVSTNKDRGKSPIVVHCSAGIGRTGTFIALDALYHQAMTEGGIRPVSVIETLRRQRINMVQTKYQYAFLHEALADALLVGTHFFWASQLPSVCNFFRGRNPEATVTRAHEQFKLICECIASSKEQQQTSSSAAAENIYEETGEPMVEPEYGNISTVQSEISEYRTKTKDRNSASIQQMNAIYLPNYAEASTYILAETPCDSSLSDLWTLVEEQNVTTIVNLTETMHPYFQTSCTLGANGGKPVGRFVVNVVKEVKHKEYTIRSIVYKEQDKENNAGFTVKMFSLSAWQQGAECPGDPDPLMALLEEVNKWHPYVSEAKPVLFICGDGRTRCGLVAAILNESQRMRNEDGHVNIVETVMMMKKRAGDVISAEQLQFLYEAVFAYALRMGYALDTGDHNNT